MKTNKAMVFLLAALSTLLLFVPVLAVEGMRVQMQVDGMV